MESSIEKRKKSLKFDVIATITCIICIFSFWFVLPYRNIFITGISIAMVFYILMSLITIPIHLYKYRKAINENSTNVN
jgi:membrane protein YdbS with pleckstrin-like domain